MTFNTVTLPEWLTYKINKPARVGVLETLDGTVVQNLGYNQEDYIITFSCNLTSSTIRDTFQTAYTTVSTVVFVDLDSVSWNVVVTEFSSTERAGKWDLVGQCQVRS